MDGSVEKLFRTHQVDQHQPFGQFLLHFFHQFVYLADDFVGVRACRLRNHGGGSRMSVYFTAVAVALRPQFHGGDVFQAEHFTAFQGCNDQIAELFGLLVASAVFQGILERVFRILTQSTRSCFHVLLVKHSRHIGRHQSVLRHLLRVEPDAHGVVISHDIDVSHAADTRQPRLDVDFEVVVDECLVVRVIGRIESDDFQHRVLPLFYRYTDLGHFSRQQSFGFAHTVLGVDGRHIGVGTLLEVDGDVAGTGISRGGSHVNHILYAVDGFFQRDDNRFLYGFGIGTGVSGRYHDGRRCDIGVLLHRQVGQADKPHQQNKHRYHTGKDGAVYKSL